MAKAVFVIKLQLQNSTKIMKFLASLVNEAK